MTTFFEQEPKTEIRIPQQGLRTALSIAGLDPSGGAGLIADVGTFAALDVHGMAVVTTLTYQNTLGLTGRYDVPGGVVLRQLEELWADRVPNAVKTGALGGADAVREVGLFLDSEYMGPVVVDPVTAAGSGGRLLEEDALQGLVAYVIPRAAVVTPNVDEAALLSGFEVCDIKDAEAAALRLVSMGARAALVTGMKIEENGVPMAADVLCDGEEIDIYSHPWVEGLRVHGTGCVLSASIAACLAKGMTLKEAVIRGREATRAAFEGAVATGLGTASANVAAVRPEDSGADGK